MKITYLIALLFLFCGTLVTSTKIGIPPQTYTPCNTSSCVWDVINHNSDVVKIVVISLNLGPGSVVDKDLLDVCVKAQLAGISIFGHVKTNLGQIALVDVKAVIDLYINLYKIDGIFFDEIIKDCSCKPYFSDLYAYVKLKLGGIVILNVGVNVPDCFGLFADILVVFDATFAEYKNFVPLAWYKTYPSSTFWHIIKSCPQAQQRSALLQAIQKKAGYVYITADVNIGENGQLLSLDLLLIIRLLRLLFINLDLNLNL